MQGTLFALLLSMNLPFIGENQFALNSSQQECFATSMIGYDYVINSRVGVPIEKALNTVSVDNNAENVKDTYKYTLKQVVTNAYQWQGSPHTYAIKVMHSCAFNQGKESTKVSANHQ